MLPSVNGIPPAKFTTDTSDRLRFCFDSSLPLGSAQHQKIVVIDGAVAFSGGLDLTIRRWDNSEHAAGNPHRLDPDGRPYPPFHDVQCMVDGEAAAALSETGREPLADRRLHGRKQQPAVWRPLAGLGAGPGPRHYWWASRGPRSRPRHDPGVNEVARLFEASINAANRFIYIENQFTSTTEFARLLAQRMLDVPSLRVLIVTPKMHSSWFESQAMQGGRGGFIDQFVAAGVMDRFAFSIPRRAMRRPRSAVMVHSKVMIVDDCMLRVGSANLNNRSMGADTECDLAFEAIIRGAPAIHRPASPRADRPFLRRGRTGNRKQ